MAADFAEFSIAHIRRNNLHGIGLDAPQGYVRGIDVLGNDFMPALRRSCRTFKKHHGYTPDLISPGSFSQRQLLFKFFAPVPLHSPSDKIGSRNYLPPEFQDKVRQPRIVWSSFTHTLPDNNRIAPGKYWFKSNHGSGRNIAVQFPLSDKERAKLKAAAAQWLTQIHDKNNALWWNEIFPRQVFLEEDLSLEHDSADDWKFFVCNGLVILYQHDQDRFGGHDQTIYDRDGNHIEKELYYRGSKAVTAPKRLNDMIALAESIGSAFDFIRVDLFVKNNEIYLGELGLVPNGCTIPIKSPVIDHILGASWSPPWLGNTTTEVIAKYAATRGKELFDQQPVDPPKAGAIWNAKTLYRG